MNQYNIDEASRYTHPIDVQLYNDRPIFELLGDTSGLQVIDIGCGNGYLSKKLQSAKKVIGIDSSPAMIEQASAQNKDVINLEFIVGSSDNLPFNDNMFDLGICSLTINLYPTVELTKKSFEEAARVLKKGGKYVISLPHPLTLNEATNYRRTIWEPMQNQDNLIPGEGFTRQFMGTDNTIIEKINYYWPPEVLMNIAHRFGLRHTKTIEPVATSEELSKYASQLETIFGEKSFFLIMLFTKV